MAYSVTQCAKCAAWFEWSKSVAARSPDLTPCDFFLWGFVKSKVYATKPRDIPELKERIFAAFEEIAVEMWQKTILEHRDRLERVIEIDGGHIEVHNFWHVHRNVIILCQNKSYISVYVVLKFHYISLKNKEVIKD